MAVVDYFVKIDGIPGESTGARHSFGQPIRVGWDHKTNKQF